jgi:hypothetical protein
MAGVRFHPGIRVLMGTVMIGVGVVAHRNTPLIVIGAVFALLGLMSLVGKPAGGGDRPPQS